VTNLKRIIVVDTETASLDAKHHRLCELAAVELIQICSGEWAMRDTFQSLSSDGLPIEPEASSIHHITTRMVAGAPSRSQVVEAMVDHFSLRPSQFPVLAAHNADFDRGAISVLRGATWVCTWRVSRHLLPDVPSRALQALRYRLNLDPPVPDGLAPHRALYDAIVAAELLRYFLAGRSVEELVALTSKPWIPPVCPIGKHKGKKWCDVPRDYLRWMTGVVDMDPETVLAAKIELGLVERPT
jgi:exodeoxyribonuclease X